MGKPWFLRTGEKIFEGKKLSVPPLSEMSGELARGNLT